jgi:4-amino-4-deoxy-L-arabinose transferase-like glycosyltransferase
MKVIRQPMDLLKVVLILALPVIPCFYDLGVLPVRIWDEARQAHNALEMYKSGHYTVPTYYGIPDTFGTKPAFLIWLMTGSIHLFGLNEFALRFPSAMSVYLLAVASMFITWHYFKSFSTALIAGIILVTCQGLIRVHIGRTADYDAPLALFDCLACFSFFIFLKDHRVLFWYATCFSIAFAVLTKGAAGFLFIPVLFIYALLNKSIIPLVRSIHTWAGILGFLLLISGYYLMRDAKQPGYLSLVLNAEWKSIYFKTAQGHDEPILYYLENFYSKWFRYYWWMMFPGVIAAFILNRPYAKGLLVFCIICFAGFMLIISNSATKLFWYDAPVYPFAAIICAGFFYYLFSRDQLAAISESKKDLFKLSIVLSIGLFGFSIISPSVIHPAEDPAEGNFYSMAAFLKKTVHENKSLDGYKVLSGNAYSPHHTFYIRQLQDRGQRVTHAVMEDLQVRDSVLVFEENIRELLLSKYKTTFIASGDNIFAYRLDSVKAAIKDVSQ